MDPGDEAKKNPSDNADLGFQAVGPALRTERLGVVSSETKRHPVTCREPSH